MADMLIDEPIDLYEHQLKEAHKNNVSKFFEDLVKKSGVNEDANATTVKVIRKKEAEIKTVDKKLKGQKGLRGFLFFLIIIGFIAGIIFILAAIGTIPIPVMQWLSILIAVLCFLLSIGLILVIALSVNKKIKNFQAIINRLEKEKQVLVDEAWKQAAPLNALYDWGMAAYLFTETVPIVKLDPYFDVKRFDYLCSKYNLIPQFDNKTSIEFVQSGEIVGNPFLIVKKLNHHMGSKTYTGSLTISWTETYFDSNGHLQTRSRSEVLHASVTKPYPEYNHDTYLLYGNEAAPDLHFTRVPLGSHKLDEHDLEKLIKKQSHKIDDMAEEAIKKSKSFNPLGNIEFEALWNALDRDNETQYRLLFTPLAQTQLKDILLDNKVGFGDDFYMVKDGMLNKVEPNHFYGMDFSCDPNNFTDYEINKSRQLFNDYNNRYFKSLFFGFAPLLCIPLYQMHKPHEFIYKDVYNYNVSFWEDETMANFMGHYNFKHPDSVTRNILKTSVVSSHPGTDLLSVTAYGYKGINRVDYVSVMGGDGRVHQVPVNWVEYLPVDRTSEMAIHVQPTLSRKDYLASLNNQGWNNFLKGKYSNVLFRRNMIAFMCNQNNSYQAKDDSTLDELLKNKSN